MRVPLRVATGRVWPSVADPDVEPPGLEVGAVRGRGELAVAALGRDPRLAVELADRRQPEVAGSGVDDPVGELELVEELLLPREQPLVLGVRLLERRVDEHLDLVEPVHPDDAAGVLAVRAGLLAEARAERRVAAAAGWRRRGSRRSGTPPSGPLTCRPGRGPRPRSGRRRRRPGRGSRCPPSPVDGRGRGDDLGEAGCAGLVEREVDQRELELRADAGQEVEAAPLPWRRARCRSRRAAGRARRGRAARSPRPRSRAGCRCARGRCSCPRRRPAPLGDEVGERLRISAHSSSAVTRAASASLTSAASTLV